MTQDRRRTEKDFERVPKEMRETDRWIVWRDVDGKKPPVGKDGRALKDWKSAMVSFGEALQRLVFPGSGLGFVHGDGWGGIDLDSCRNVETGEIDSRAEYVVQRAESYAEISPSGEGLKIFGRTKDGDWLELNFHDATTVTAQRKPSLYFTVTGNAINDLNAEADLTTVIDITVGYFGAGADTPTVPGERKLPERVERGMQNDVLFREGCRHRAAGKTEDEIYGIFLAIRNRFVPQPSHKALREIARSCCRYEAGKEDGFPLTETGDSEFFASKNAEGLRYDHRRGRWLLFDGVRWRPQSHGEVDRLALEAVRGRQSAAVGDKDRTRWAIGGESRGRRANLLALAQSAVPLADPGDAWDDNPWLLGAPNGVIDLRTGEIRPGKWDDRITMQTRFPFSSSSRSELWERTVADIFQDDPDVVNFVHKALGYSLTGDCREEVFFLCRGEGRNGKGTILNTIAHVLGDYHDNLSFHSLERGQHGPKESTNDIAKLQRRRFVTASENYGGRLDESRVKSLTGRDPITARFLYAEEFTFVPEFKLWLSVNHPPKIRDDSEGFWARTRVVPFKRTFKDNPDTTLKDRLLDEGEGVLAWLVAGCLRWQQEGLGAPAAVRVAVENYRQAEDLLNEFYEECCVVAPEQRTRPSALFESYARWCERTRVRFRMGQKGFSQQVGKRFKRTARNGVAYFSDIGLASERGSDHEGGI